MTFTSNKREPTLLLEEVGSELARWKDMGVVEQMREDADGWVFLVERLEEQLEAQQRLLFAADEAFRWVAREYPKVIREMPPNLYRELREARVPYPASRQDA